MPIVNSVIKGKGKQPVIDTLSVTPTTSAQTITAPSGTDGYNPISVAAVTAAIDNNITAGNIKSGVSILGVSGSVTELNGTTTTINPSTSSQTVAPTLPNNGFTEVTVSAVTSAIDANIVAGNIKDGVTILGVTGDYQGGVTPTGTKNIIENGTYDVTNFASANVNVPTGPTYYISRVVQNGELKQGNDVINLSGVTSIGSYGLCYAYTDNKNISTIPDFSSIQSFTENSCCTFAFKGCTNLSGKVDLSSLRVIGSYYVGQCCAQMFSNCSNITEVDMSSLETIYGNNAIGMFSYCSKLESIDLSNLTYAENLDNMFEGCEKLEEIDLSNLSTDNISLSYTFAGCTALNSVNLSGVNYINTIEGTFAGCTNIDESSFNGGGLYWGYMGAANAFSGAGKTGAKMFIGFSSMGDQYSILDSNAFVEMFYSSNYSIIEFGELTEIYGTTSTSSIYQGSCNEIIYGSAAHGILFPKLSSLSGRYLFYNGFSYCNNLYAMYFPSLCNIPSANTQNMFNNAFSYCDNLRHLSFPGFTPEGLARVAALNNMLVGCTNVTMHFPITMQSKLSSTVSTGLGGTDCTALFDLVSSFTDSDGNTYTRYGEADIIDEWGIIDDSTSDLDGKNYINLLYEAWVDENQNIYYTRCAGADVVNSHDADKEGCGWVDSEPKVDDVIYDNDMQPISATVASVA